MASGSQTFVSAFRLLSGGNLIGLHRLIGATGASGKVRRMTEEG